MLPEAKKYCRKMQWTIVYIYYPGKRFPSLSVTGKFCALRCKHCMGHYLQHMVPVETPEKLIEFVEKNKEKINGFLLSGGSTPQGKVPLKKFVDAIKWVKKNTELRVNIHTGIIEREDLEYIKEMSPDHISFDVIGDTSVIERILGLKRSGEDYYDALHLLDSSTLSYSPHVIIGLDYGRIHWEYETLELISTLKNFSNVVLLVLLPTPGTPMENVKINEDEVIDVLKFAANKISPEKLVLGCMRPRNMIALEMEAVKLGIKGIVMPSLRTLKYMEEMGIGIERRETCCVF